MAKKIKTAGERCKPLIEKLNKKLSNLDDKEQIKQAKIDCINEVMNTYVTYIHEIIEIRMDELKHDTNEHHMMYEVFGLPEHEQYNIDKYHNIARLIYSNCGSLMEKISMICLGGKKFSINNLHYSPKADNKTFTIDCYTKNDNRAHEIKWRDSTTDGDHSDKEEAKINSILDIGYIPVRVMFFMPERNQSKSKQEKILSIYKDKGLAFVGKDAFKYIYDYSDIDIYKILQDFISKVDPINIPK